MRPPLLPLGIECPGHWCRGTMPTSTDPGHDQRGWDLSFPALALFVAEAGNEFLLMGGV